MSPIAFERIQRLTERIAAEFRPDRILLFGSFAHGTPGPDSDADLFVIMPFSGSPARQAAAVRRRVCPDFPVDIVVRTTEQVRERLALGDRFVSEVLSSGKVLYESPLSRMG